MQDTWGMEFATMRERRQIREREKKRRQRAMQASRQKATASVVVMRRAQFDVFVTSSGLKAVRPRHARADGSCVSLAYVQFLHGVEP